MKNVTIILNEETAAWTRTHAAHCNMSMSRFIAKVLNDKMDEARKYDQAMKTFLGRQAMPLSNRGEPYPNRDQVNDRRG